MQEATGFLGCEVGLRKGAWLRYPRSVLPVAALCLLPTLAGAAEGDLETDDVRFEHEARAFEDVAFDTGWQPPGAPVQVRITFNLGGGLEADLPGRADLTWDPLEAVFVGETDAGRFGMDLGAEFQATLRLGLDLPGGGRLDWEGDVPFVPAFDLRLADEETFTPFLLPGSPDRPATLSDVTDRIEIYQYDITDVLVPLPGIGGGVGLDAMGSLDAGLRGERIVVGDIWETTEELAAVRLLPSGTATIETTARYEATVDYDGTITLYPYVFVEFAGAEWELDLVEIPIPIEAEDLWVFEPEALAWNMPDVAVSPLELDFGRVEVGRAAEARLSIENRGRHRLLVSMDLPPSFGSSRPELELFAEAATLVTIEFAPEGAGTIEDVLVLTTNDPDTPTIEISLRGVGVGGEPDAGADAGDPDGGGEGGPGGDVRRHGGCGCGASSRVGGVGGAAGAWSLLAFSAASRRRRRSG